MATFDDVLLDIGLDLKEFEKEFTKELKNSIADKSPVDTGELKASWEVDGDEIQSDADHAMAVEFGTSNRPPVGMVRRTVVERQRIADKVTNKVGRMK